MSDTDREKEGTDEEKSSDDIGIAVALLEQAHEEGTVPDFKALAKQTGVKVNVLTGKWTQIKRRDEISRDLLKSTGGALGGTGRGTEQLPSGTAYIFTPEQIENLKAGMTVGQRKLVESYQNAPGVKQTLNPSATKPTPSAGELDLGLDMREISDLMNIIRRERLKAMLQEQVLRGLTSTSAAEPSREGPKDMDRKFDELRAEIKSLREGDKLEALRVWVEKKTSETAAAGKQPDPVVERLQKELDDLKESKREKDNQEFMKVVLESMKDKKGGFDMKEYITIQQAHEKDVTEIKEKYETERRNKEVNLQGYREQLDAKEREFMQKRMDWLERQAEKGRGEGDLDKLVSGVDKITTAAGKLGYEKIGDGSKFSPKDIPEILRGAGEMARDIAPIVTAQLQGGAPQVPTKACDGCGTQIPIPAGATSITCPGCGKIFHKSGQRQPPAQQQQPPPTEAAPTGTPSSSDLYFPGSENLPP